MAFSRSHQNCLVLHEKRSLFSVQQQPLRDCHEMHRSPPTAPHSVCVWVECVAPVVAINPNLADTDSKSTFREP